MKMLTKEQLQRKKDKKSNTFPHLAYPDYLSAYPHKGRTVGYAGRPSVPAWDVKKLKKDLRSIFQRAAAVFKLQTLDPHDKKFPYASSG
jgi:hypothetical protein